MSSVKKNKVNLSDYDCQQDIEYRLLLSDLSFFEHEVLQEIFFSPLKFQIKKICRALDCEEAKILPVLKKFSKSGLLAIQDDTVLVDKEKRKFFEFHLKRFEPDFKPDMEYLQGILRKVPIHVLPIWYAIPRTSNNIFESIVEKYLYTPQSFQRYLSELSFANPIAHQVMNDVFTNPDFRVSSSDIITKYNLSRQEFEEILLILEFSFVACVTYSKGEDLWLEWVTPFHEWQEYILFIKQTEINPIPKDKKIIRHEKSDFWFVEKLNHQLSQIQKKSLHKDENIDKILHLQLATSQFSLSETGHEFIQLTPEKQALFLYRHPLNQAADKNIREVEKSMKRVIRHDWIFFDDFMKGCIACLNDSMPVCLARVGKTWKYILPVYTDSDIQFIQRIVFEWLAEIGIVATGTCDGRDCFSVTEFGSLFFR
ncbi:MAG TPA: hypothetical protein VLE96_07165 [Chlamydiales bacterium]|nr:hypothetical protein [Chlamydiales bacterium]